MPSDQRMTDRSARQARARTCRAVSMAPYPVRAGGGPGHADDGPPLLPGVPLPGVPTVPAVVPGVPGSLVAGVPLVQVQGVPGAPVPSGVVPVAGGVSGAVAGPLGV